MSRRLTAEEAIEHAKRLEQRADELRFQASVMVGRAGPFERWAAKWRAWVADPDNVPYPRGDR